MKTLAPISLFVYNRPEHARSTLESLSLCNNADQSKLFVFSDGPKNESDIEKVKKVREILRAKKWCRETEIIEAPGNMGLAKSLIAGITRVVDEYGAAIVIEDDLHFSPAFLSYLNTALDLYQDEEKVMAVSAFMFPVKAPLPETFFLRIPTWSGGWATWKRAWKHFNQDAFDLIEKVENEGAANFDFKRSINYMRLLKRNARAQVDSWAIRWYASVFVNRGLALHPHQSLTRNTGFDKSGTHSYKSRAWETRILQDIHVEAVPVTECKKAVDALIRFNWRLKINDIPHYIRLRLQGKYNKKVNGPTQ